MKNKFKIISVILMSLVLGRYALPFQSDKYPSWTTNGILEAYTLTDGRLVDGWMGAKVGQKINAKWYDLTVNYAEILDEYEGYKASDGKKLVHASITVENTSDKIVYLFDGDFALVCNLQKEERSYTYSMDAYAKDMLSNEMSVNIGETKIIHTVYEIDKDIDDTMAIYYYEQYSDGQKGNKYYVYIN